MKLRVTILPLLLLAVFSTAQNPEPVPVVDEPHHRLLLQNNDVLVIHVTVNPGETTLYHTHSHDGVALDLAHATITLQPWHSPEGAPKETHPGDISVRVLNGEPYSHRLHNVGQTAFEVFDVEFLRATGNSSPSVTSPVTAEIPEARVYRWTLAPGSSMAMHTHVRPYLIVAATAFPLRMTAPDGQSMSHEIKPGDFHWIASKVTHSLANDGKEEAQIVEIELK